MQSNNYFTVLEGDFIEEGSGTGIVHLAPGFGEDDQRVCAEAGIGIVCPVDEAGCYTEHIFDLPHSPLAGESESALEKRERSGGGYSEFASEKAKKMRYEPTDAERKLWQKLNKEQLGIKFRRQQPIGKYVVDFYSAEKRLVIEVDGGQHADDTSDEKRTAWLESQGLEVLRFWNDEVLRDTRGVLDQIHRHLI